MSTYAPLNYGALLAEKNVLLAAPAGELMQTISNTLREQGAAVYCVEKNGRAADQLPCGCMVRGRLADEVIAETIIQEVLQQAGSIDSIVFCADPVFLAKSEDLSGAAASAFFENNWLALHNLVSHALPAMKRQCCGTLVAVTSDYAVSAVPGVSVYSSVMAAMNAYVRAVGMECCKFDIRGNSVMAGFNIGANGDVFEAALGKETAQDAFRRYQVLPRQGSCQDVANSVLFCASPLSNSINGESFPVNGGALVIGHSNVWNPKDKPVYSTWGEHDKKDAAFSNAVGKEETK